MFNKCALNAHFIRPRRVRKVKCDNRNVEKGYFPGPAPGTDEITVAKSPVRAVHGFSGGPSC